MATGATSQYHWNFPICPTRVTIDLSVIGAFQHDLATPGDRQGFLYGKGHRNATHVNGREPILALDRDAMAASVANPRRTIVGFYRIREGSAFILNTEEIEIATELFKRPGSVVLLVERRASGPAEATFYFWRGDTFVHNLPMPFPLDAERLAAGDPRAASEPGRRLSRKYRVGLQRAGAVAAGALVGIGVGAVMMRGGPSKPTPTATHSAAAPAVPTVPTVPAVEAAKPGSAIEFLWDPKSMPAATQGLLEINDGGERRTIPLDSDQLRDGSLVYQPASASVRAELSTLQRDGHVVDNQVTMRPSSQSMTVVSAAPAAAMPAVASPVTPAPPYAPDPAAPTAARGGREAASAPKPSEPVASAADRRIVLRPFTISTTRARPEQQSAPIVVDPPAVGPPPVTAAVLPAFRPHLPPPAPARTTPPAGRVIWTGTLARRGIVEVDGRSSSIGSISGALPGVPVSLTVYPAEFGNDGLVVYTTEASRHNRVEPASAATGWNKVTWVWDPTRVHEISILEPPNAANNFSRLAFRSDARRTSMVWIDWHTK